MTPSSWIPLMVSAAAIPCNTGSAPKPIYPCWSTYVPCPSQVLVHGVEIGLPSQLRPPAGILPSGPIEGPSTTLTPFRRASFPRARPRLYIRSRFHVAPVVSPAGKAVIRSAKRRPSGPSCRHRAGNPESIAGPIQQYVSAILISRILLSKIGGATNQCYPRTCPTFIPISINALRGAVRLGVQAEPTIDHPTPVVTFTFSTRLIFRTIFSALAYASCHEAKVPPRAMQRSQ